MSKRFLKIAGNFHEIRRSNSAKIFPFVKFFFIIILNASIFDNYGAVYF